MIRSLGSFGFATCVLACAPLVYGGDDLLQRPIANAAPMEIPHAVNVDLDYRASRRNRSRSNVEPYDLLNFTPGLSPLQFPKYSDVRARILTSQLRSTPIVGWLAENLYRNRKDNGWCLEVDPGEGEYVVFYRLHLK